MEIEEKDGIFSMTHQIISQIVKEEDEYIMSVIDGYVKSQQRIGNFVSAKIIPEGQLKHILNLGMIEFSKQIDYDLNENELFKQEEYIEYLRHQIRMYQKENSEIKTKLRELIGGE